MGLSNTEAKEKLTSLQVAVDLIASIKELAANPDFAQLSKDAYAIPEKDQVKADEARAKIAEYTAIIAEQKKLQVALSAEQDDIDKRAGEVEEALKTLSVRKTELDKLSRSLDDKAETLSLKAKEQASVETGLDNKQAKLDSDTAAFEKEKQRVADKENELDAKADKLKALIG